jgi:hypothetical protein
MEDFAQTQVSKILFWKKLNRVPYNQYLRFKRMFQAKNNGKMIIGISIEQDGIINFNLQ